MRTFPNIGILLSAMLNLCELIPDSLNHRIYMKVSLVRFFSLFEVSPSGHNKNNYPLHSLNWVNQCPVTM
jgi:hypothetical protein